MSIKITGMNSGLDTDAIVRELVSAASTKKETLEKAQTKLEWKQDAWKGLNKKIKSFQATISNLRFSDAFKKKTTSISNSSLASIVTGDNAVNGSQTLAVKQLAKTGYLTGGQLSKNKSIKGSTKLSELTKGTDMELGKDDKASFGVKVGGTTTYIELTGESTIDEVVMKLNDAGVTASFDTTNQRFFISAKTSGAEGDFQMTANNVDGLKALSALGLLTEEEVKNNKSAQEKLAGYWDPDAEGLNASAAEELEKRADAYAASMQKSLASASAVQGYFDKIETLQHAWDIDPMKNSYEAALEKYAGAGSQDLDAAKAKLNEEKEKLDADRAVWAEKTEYLNLTGKKASLAEGETLSEAEQQRLDELNEKFKDEPPFTQDDLDAEATRIADKQGEIMADESAFKSYDSLQAAIKVHEDAITLAAKTAGVLNTYYEQANADMLQKFADEGIFRAEDDTYSKKLERVEAEITAATASGSDTTELDAMKSLLTKMAANEELGGIIANEDNKKISDLTGVDLTAGAPESPDKRAERELAEDAKGAYEVLKELDGEASKYLSASAKRIEGQDGVIELNGAEFTSSSNTFSINGLTITAKAESNVLGKDENGNTIYEQAQITTQDDIDGIYKMIKNVIKEYNELIKEIDTLYNAESAKDYEPLTSEEKAAMSDDEVEKWEEKIKSALLRHDSELGSVRTMLKESVSTSFMIGGKKFSLADFGIFTQDYFSADDNERSMLHIDGDSEDDVSSGNKDLLKKMLASDPDTVSKFFNQFANSLYDKMRAASTTLTGVRSYGSFYSDKTLTTQYDDYKTKIKKQEDKVAKLEDKYYKMFSSMETAMAKINSTSSYITSMFG
ncbi:MAG: flagellar filament capping protein FliD [bacterium]|nr:flagellar filament capping protein FliD [bacterium]